ncbi:MAG TPA: hypothetical protein VGC97_05675 [Pyrinomonadaceae bacterium]|jgi:hypothetical protein
MIKQIEFYLIFLILLVSGGCKQSVTSLSVENGKRSDSELITTVNSFFTPSAKELTVLMVRPFPERFSECLLMSPEECFNNRQKKQNSNLKYKENSNRFEVILVKDSEISILVKDYQDKINSNQVILNQIKSVWTTNDESRVRVELVIREKKTIKDLLLFRDERWQIFEIANENEYPNFAQPTENNKVF